MKYYIASCVFTSRYPELSFRILDYVRRRGDVKIVRCCVMHYREQDFTEMMPEQLREEWRSYPSSADFQPGDIVYSLCHNCTAILQEWKEGIITRSLWEYVLEDESFCYPDFHNKEMFVQDCWRSKENRTEQNAVRAILNRSSIRILEAEKNHELTDFCGNSLYRPAPVRNLKLAPKRFVENACGMFEPHSMEDQKRIMEDYVRQFEDKEVIAYCHYCHEGLLLGGAKAYHLARLLFEADNG